MQVSALGRNYLKWFAGRGASPRTIECYDLTYSQFVAFLMGQGKANDIREFTPETVDGFVTFLEGANLKSSSINVKLAGLHSLGEYGVKSKGQNGKYLLAENPLNRVFRPKRQKPKEKYLYKVEVLQLLRAPRPATLQVAIEMVVDTALRASELTNANVADLSMDGDRTLLAIRLKGGRERTITLGTDMAAKLIELLKFREAAPGTPLLVNERGERYTRTTLSEMILRQAIRAGITRIPVRAHVLRHSVATLASANGVDVPTIAAMLNHSDIHTVSRYVHRQDAVDAARDKVREALR